MKTSLLCIQYSYIPPLFAPALSSSLFNSSCIQFSYHGLSLLLVVYYLRTQESMVSDWWPGLCIYFHINLFFQPVPLTAVFSLSVLKIGRVNKKEYALVLPAAWGKEFDKYFVFVDMSGLDSAAVSMFVIILVEWQILYQYLSVQPIYLQILRRQCCLVWTCYSFHFSFHTPLHFILRVFPLELLFLLRLMSALYSWVCPVAAEDLRIYNAHHAIDQTHHHLIFRKIGAEIRFPNP